MKSCFCAAFALSLVSFLSVAQSGTDISGGDPVPFVMPAEDFAFNCKLLVRGQENKDSPFIWATKSITIPKTEFLTNENQNAYFVYSTTADGWEIDTSTQTSSMSSLPKFLVGHQFVLGMDMAANTGLSSKDVAANLISKITFPEQDLRIASNSGDFEFHKISTLATDVSFGPKANKYFVGLTAKCTLKVK